MDISFNAHEIFEIAEQIELNGIKFYTKAAEKCADKGMREFMLSLAEMEKNHASDFAEMKGQLGKDSKKQVIFDPDDEMVYYLKALAVDAGWEGKAGPRMEFDGTESPAEIITAAIHAEKASIDYYVGLKYFVSDSDKDKVEQIIKEEMLHVAKLQKELERIS